MTETKMFANGLGVFVDASYNDGVAIISVVKRNENSAEILIRKYTDCKTNKEAELEAIRLANTKWPNEIIYSDCQNSVHLAEREGIQAVWIKRTKNRLADHLTRML